MQNSTIEWTDHTFNPWWGCIRVSPGCEHCYAETLAKRYGHAVWGPAKTTPRRMMSENYWRQPLKWDRLAQVSGRKRVFCASMADVFEDHPQVINARMRLFNLIEATPNLDWLLLTKRPENIRVMMADWLHDFPSNIWIGTSVENQEQAEKRIPHLLNVPARVRFLSCEPLLSAVDLSPWLNSRVPPFGLVHTIDWVIAGGESGHEARYCDLRWVRGLRDRCQADGVSFFMKQWGEYVPKSQAPDGCPEPPIGPRSRRSAQALASALGEPHPDQVYWRVGKHAAGRLLDGRTWDELPN